MKRLILLCVAASLLCVCPSSLNAGDDKNKDKESGPPGLQKRDKLPPGLEKKNKLPPGWQKKVGEAEEPTPGSVPATQPAPVPATPAPPVPAPAPAPSATPAPDPGKPAPPAPAPASKPPQAGEPPKAAPDAQRTSEQHAAIKQYSTSINETCMRNGTNPAVLDRVARKAGISSTQLKAQRKDHPEMGLGGLYMANIISRFSGKPFNAVIAARKTGKTWGVIAQESGADLDKVIAATKDTSEAVNREAQRAAAGAPATASR